ncbi:MAG: CRISPR-associated protein Cas5 [Desulfurococcales archaeon]|nr:CRISPR-associated protein Cas5 [Desulfurococcales archaeon]
MLHAYRFRVEFVWGHQSRIIGLSKTNPSYYYPPPTTIIGAIGEVLAKKYRLGEKPETTRRLLAEISSKILAIGVKPVNAVPVKHMDINKILAVKITGGIRYPSTRNILGSFDAPARGKTIMSSLDGNPPMIDIALVLTDIVFNIGGKRVKLYKDVLWGIHRLGSKESIVSTIRVDYSTDVGVEEGIVVTKYSFPVTNGVEPLEEIRRKWVYEVYVDPFKMDPRKSVLEAYLRGDYVTVYRVPIKIEAIKEPSIKLRISKPMAAYNIKFNGRHREIIVGRSA